MSAKHYGNRADAWPSSGRNYAEWAAEKSADEVNGYGERRTNPTAYCLTCDRTWRLREEQLAYAVTCKTCGRLADKG